MCTLAEQGKGEAYTWVNKVRARALVNMLAVTTGDLVEVVRHERRVEFLMEGICLFDLLRWKNLGEVFGDGTKVKRHFYCNYVTGASTKYDAPLLEIPKHYLFPIPQEELDLNTSISINNTGH